MSSSKPTVIKVIAVGECGIGKTSLMLSYSDPQFDPKSNPSTTGVDVINFPTTINGKPVVVQLWDTAGQEKFRVITSSYYKAANVAVLAYDITDSETFEPLQGWDQEIDRFHVTSNKVTKIVIGTKADLEDQRAVERSEGEKAAKDLGDDVLFAETTIFDRKTVTEALTKAVTEAFRVIQAEEQKKSAEAGDDGEDGDVVKISRKSKKGKKDKKGSCFI